MIKNTNYLIFNFSRKYSLFEKLKNLKYKIKKKDDIKKEKMFDNEVYFYKKMENVDFLNPSHDFLAKNNLPIMNLPENLVKRCRQIFTKYSPEEIRNSGKKYLKIYQLLHAIEKPMDLSKNKIFANTSELLLKKEDLIYQMKKRKKNEYISSDDFKKNIKDESKKTLNEKILEYSNFKSTKEFEDVNPYPVPEYDRAISIAYLAKKLPENYCHSYRILLELKKKMPEKKFENILDFGSGLGGTSHAISNLFTDVKIICNIDKSTDMRKLGKFITQDISTVVYKSSLKDCISTKENGKFDLIYLSNVLEELKDSNERIILIQSLWDLLDDDGIFIVSEPGSPMGFRFINDVRKLLINVESEENDNNIIGPCPHLKKCPLESNPQKWCNFEQIISRFNKNILPKSPKEMPQIKSKFSYIIINKNKPKLEENDDLDTFNKTLYWNRIISPPKKRGGHVILETCNVEGDISDIIVSRSHNNIEEDRYKLSKKLKWGDCWPYTFRIPNKFRKEKKKGKRLW